jgi:hypothetical protein
MEELNLYARIIMYLFKRKKFKVEEKKSPHEYAMECIHLLRLDKYARIQIISILSALINEKSDITKQDFDSMVKKLKNGGEINVDNLVKHFREVSVKKI